LRILADMHVHSNFSVDAKDDLKFMCQAAVKKGLKYICFAEHFDMNPKDCGYQYFDLEKFSEAIDSARGEFRDNLCILKGLEFGEPYLYPREFENMVKKDFDVIIGAVHWVGELFVGKKEIGESISVEEFFERYYREVLKEVKFGGFDVLAHLDFPKRYLKQSSNQSCLTNEIFEELLKCDIALEINTSPLRRGLNESSPGEKILAEYTKAGGDKVTVGSDAHSSLDIGEGFQYVHDLIERNGRIKPGIFRKHKFIQIL